MFEEGRMNQFYADTAFVEGRADEAAKQAAVLAEIAGADELWAIYEEFRENEEHLTDVVNEVLRTVNGTEDENNDEAQECWRLLDRLFNAAQKMREAMNMAWERFKEIFEEESRSYRDLHEDYDRLVGLYTPEEWGDEEE